MPNIALLQYFIIALLLQHMLRVEVNREEEEGRRKRRGGEELREGRGGALNLNEVILKASSVVEAT